LKCAKSVKFFIVGYINCKVWKRPKSTKQDKGDYYFIFKDKMTLSELYIYKSNIINVKKKKEKKLRLPRKVTSWHPSATFLSFISTPSECLFKSCEVLAKKKR